MAPEMATKAVRSRPGARAKASTAKVAGMPTAWVTASMPPAAPSDIPWSESSEGSQPMTA